MIKAIISDLDGTLGDHEPLASQAYEIVLAEYGKVAQRNGCGLVHEPGLTGNMAELVKKYGLACGDLEKLRNRWRVIYHRLLKDHPSPMPGLEEFKATLRSIRFLRAAVATQSSEKSLKIAAEGLGLYGYFSKFISAEQVANPKPAPDIYLLAAQQLDVEPSKCMVIEDSNAGVISGKRAGMTVIAIRNRYTAHHDFSSAELVLGSLAEVTPETIRSF